MNKVKFIADVKLRLAGFGFPVKPGGSDDMFIEFSYEKVVNQIKHRINRSSIPKGLYEIAVDMVCAEYLYMKDGLGQIDKEAGDYDITASAKKIQDGDTNVEFSTSAAAEAASDPAVKFAALLDYLRHSNGTDFTHYRRMLW